MPYWLGENGIAAIEPDEVIIDDKGYRRIFDGISRIRLEHNLIWERHYQRRLPKGHVIHHKDGNVQNNSVDNLELMTRGEHSKLHYKLRKEKSPNWNLITERKR